MNFKMRTTKPTNIPYYIRKADGGYSDACKGKPTDPTATVLSNCVGYANGRFAEIIGKPCIEYQLVCNAENFIERAKSMGLKISDKPTLGGIMCWQKGSTLGGKDGAGHVCVVEKIVNENTIITSESGYNAKSPFWNQTRTNKNGNWGASSEYRFRGCIVNPAVSNGYWLNGYDYSPVFNPEYYDKVPARSDSSETLGDVFGHDKDKLWEHFCVCGMNEFRQGSAEFDPIYYRDHNPDVEQAFKDDRPMYYFHYVACGKDERRKGNDNQ